MTTTTQTEGTCRCGELIALLCGTRQTWVDGHMDWLCTDAEVRAIMALRRLGKRWPKSLTLVSMGGQLFVIRSDDEHFHHPDGIVRGEAVIQHIPGIPNDGGDW